MILGLNICRIDPQWSQPHGFHFEKKTSYLAAKMRQCPGQLQPQKNPKDIYIYIFVYIYTHTVYLQLQDVTSVREG